MGRHSKPEPPPPPKNKPRYRFVVAISAIILLAFASMAVVATVFPERAPQAQASPEDPPASSDQPPNGPQPQAVESSQVSVPADGQVEGSFAMSQDWNEGFIGAVQLSNSARSAQMWQVQLLFPANVGALQARWITGGPGDTTVTRAGQSVTFAGQAPLPAGAHIGVFFQFAKAGGDPTPTNCSVNGRGCMP